MYDDESRDYIKSLSELLMLFEPRADAVFVSTLKLSNLFSVFVHLKGGHTFDTFSARDYASFVYVAPAESPACVLFFYRQSCEN